MYFGNLVRVVHGLYQIGRVITRPMWGYGSFSMELVYLIQPTPEDLDAKEELAFNNY